MPNKKLNNTEAMSNVLQMAVEECQHMRHQFITPEHILHQLFTLSSFCAALLSTGANPDELEQQVQEHLNAMEQLPEGKASNPQVSQQTQQLMVGAAMQAINAENEEVDVPHYVHALLHLGNESWASYLLRQAIGGDEADFMEALIDSCNQDEPQEHDSDEADAAHHSDQKPQPRWLELVTDLNQEASSHNPLIGREAELERTIEVLCRKDKNNPLHVGEPGVGKTALVYGLASRINSGQVPERLQGCHIYGMDIGTMVAGAQYRGEFEKRIKQVMEGARQEGNVIIYIDEIHNLVGAGQSGEGSLDASNLLKPYLETGDIRFIGSTTFDEYKRHFARAKGIVRRFQEIDIQEPSVEDTILILKGLQQGYADFHHVTYQPQAIDYAVRAAAKHITGRFLPDKAIDLIDEAGAYRELHPVEGKKKQVVDKALIDQVLAQTCKIDAKALKSDDNSALEMLEENIQSCVFGQDEAVRQVVEAVQMAKAGLQDDDKPLASLLFVGPTGVGKTEVARVLAQKLGVSLVRFDMSEYTEKHTVAKLIGSPAGYVGYDDGGLLTDAIRKTPNCVLLLDEIEKAHPDIYNILLQVMDYAVLTDNKGQKADFRNVVLIMTSNAGAQYASMANVGFNRHESRGQAMLTQVKKTFKPEFINRLTATVVFHDMDASMARQILYKKLHELQEKLTKKQVKLALTDAAFDLLLREGFTAEYGAREMDRVIARKLKPMLMREILFGSLTQGGKITIDEYDGNLEIK